MPCERGRFTIATGGSRFLAAHWKACTGLCSVKNEGRIFCVISLTKKINGVSPEEVVEPKAPMGMPLDKSQVWKGIGEKTATALGSKNIGILT